MNFSYEENGILNYIPDSNNSAQSTVLSKEVLIYDFEKNADIFHCIYLQKNGDLVYCRIQNQEITKTLIGKFDIGTNHYHKIALLIINSKLNIFYSYSNLVNSNIYTLQHIIYNREMENRYNIMRFVSNKREDIFSVVDDSHGNIHLLYNTSSTSYSYIYYTSFNIFNKRWINDPIKVSNDSENCVNPYLFSDKQGNIHGIWWEKKEKDYLLKYSRLNMHRNKKSKWQKIIIPSFYSDDANCKVNLEGNVINIDSGIKKIVSKDLGLSWKIAQNDSGPLKSETAKEYIGSQINISNNLVNSTKNENNNLSTKEYLDNIWLTLENIKSNQMEIRIEQENIKEMIKKVEKSTNSSKPPFISKLFSDN